MELTAPLASTSNRTEVTVPVVRRGRSAQWLVGCWLALVGSGLATAHGALSLTGHVLLATVCLVMLMVVAHDAIHSAAHGDHRLNSVVGWMASVACGVPFPMLMNNHLRHHRHVDTAADPERFCVGPAWQLPMRWPGMLAFYYLDTWPRLSRRAQTQSVVFLSSLVIAVAVVPQLVTLWVLPLVGAATLFACFTVWLPHGPLGDVVMRLAPGLTGYHDDHHARPAFPAHQYRALNRWHVATGVTVRKTPAPPPPEACTVGARLATEVLETAAKTTHSIDVAPALERAVVELALGSASVAQTQACRALGQWRRGSRVSRHFGALGLRLAASRISLRTGEGRQHVFERLTSGQDLVLRHSLELLSRQPLVRAKVERELSTVTSDDALDYLGQVVKEVARLHPVAGFTVPHQAWRHAQAFDPSRFSGDRRRMEFEREVISMLAAVLRRAQVNVRSGFVANPRRGLEVRVHARAEPRASASR